MSTKTSQSYTLSTKVSNALKVLAQICENREEELANVPSDATHEDSDCKNDLASHMFDFYYINGGSQTLLEMSNFNFSEFDCLRTSCCTHLTEKLLLGQGKKTEVAPKDLLFIVLCVLNAATH